jgi:hypothetical protein
MKGDWPDHGRSEGAIAAYQKVLELRPGNVPPD